MHRYSLPTKSYPVLNGKRVFFYANASTAYQSKRVYVGWICRKPSIASANKDCSAILSNRSLRLSYLSTEIISNKTGDRAINLFWKLSTYAKDLHFSRTCSRLVDVRDDMIPYCKKSSWKSFFRHLLHSFVIVFIIHFLPVLYTVVNYPNAGFTRSFVARSAHKSNKIYNKIQNIWFQLPTYSVLQLTKQCLRKNVVLHNFCLCVYK